MGAFYFAAGRSSRGRSLAAWGSRLAAWGRDVLTYATTTGVMLAAATIAAVIASWRIRRIAPLDALRAE
jgi:hypothetical protein